MKKLILSLMVCGILTTSCSTESVTVNTESMKSDELVSFDKAMKSLLDPNNLSTPEERAKNGNSTELNERSREILYQASKQLVLSTGIKEQELTGKTKR